MQSLETWKRQPLGQPEVELAVPLCCSQLQCNALLIPAQPLEKWDMSHKPCYSRTCQLGMPQMPGCLFSKSWEIFISLKESKILPIFMFCFSFFARSVF